MTVEHIETRVVSASDASSLKQEPVTLSAFDSLALPYIPIAVVFIYPEAISVKRLENALSRCLCYYPRLTGRLETHPDGRVDVVKVGQGATLHLAKCSLSIKDMATGKTDISLLDLPDGGNAFLGPYDMSKVEEEPLLSVQHTSLGCGGVALGIRIRHCMCDADGFFQFVLNLVETYNDGAIKKIPVTEPWVPPAVDPSFQPVDYYVASEPTAAPTTDNTQEEPPQRKTFGKVVRFSPQVLQKIKQAAQSPELGWVSTFEALTAHIWQCVTRARLEAGLVKPEQTSDILTPVNCRKRLSLPDSYFPNALVTPIHRLNTKTLADAANLPLIARVMHDMLQDFTPERISKTIAWIGAQKDRSKVEHTFEFMPAGFMLSTWSKFDMYSIKFGKQESVLVSTPFTEISLLDSLAYLLPTKERDGSIDLNIAISEPAWERLKDMRDFFMQ